MPVGQDDGEPEAEWPQFPPGEPPSPANVGAQSPGPEVSSPAPPILGPLPATDEAPPSEEDERAEEETEEPLPEFDPQYALEFEGLLFIGKLQRDFKFMGHKFVIRTLTTDEVLEVALLHQPYVGTLGDLRAYQTLMAAACLVSVDKKKLPLPLTNNEDDSELRNRWNYVRDNYFPVTIDAIYSEYVLLEDVVQRVVQKMGEALG